MNVISIGIETLGIPPSNTPARIIVIKYMKMLTLFLISLASRNIKTNTKVIIQKIIIGIAEESRGNVSF